MDPDAALARIRELVEEITQRIDADEEFDHVDDEANEVADIFRGLDEWIKKGGFLPKDWGRNN